MSPGHSEQSVDDDDAIVVDVEPRYSGAETSSPRSLAHQHTMDVDTDSHPAAAVQSAVDSSGEVSSVSQRPIRLLEDEKVHLQKSGLKLTDFEVRGTLG